MVYSNTTNLTAKTQKKKIIFLKEIKEQEQEKEDEKESI